MNRQPNGPSPAEREELARMAPVPADRDLPAGRRPVLKEHLMHEIEQTAAAPAPRRRRRLTAIAVPVAIAAAVGVAFTVLGSTGAKPSQAAGGTTEKIVNANYTLEKGRDGWVEVSVKITSKLDQAKIRADFERVGIPAEGIFVARDDCDAAPPGAGHRKSLPNRQIDKIYYPGKVVNEAFVWHVKPSAIPAGYYFDLTLMEEPADSPSGIAGIAVSGIAQGPPPACRSAHPGERPFGSFPPGPTSSGVGRKG
ncbi:hypothetical protein [Streptomyces sp. NBC_01198]|uniref:hypothetical protein n=1 Tax=Streptomyces sp. NBC_01198 TaxID=2903769 RepID=UPI002E10360C|nr:hypothetical protein OG702_21650 [Streptomyces sp. NBC_01198]